MSLGCPLLQPGRAIRHSFVARQIYVDFTFMQIKKFSVFDKSKSLIARIVLREFKTYKICTSIGATELILEKKQKGLQIHVYVHVGTHTCAIPEQHYALCYDSIQTTWVRFQNRSPSVLYYRGSMSCDARFIVSHSLVPQSNELRQIHFCWLAIHVYVINDSGIYRLHKRQQLRLSPIISMSKCSRNTPGHTTRDTAVIEQLLRAKDELGPIFQKERPFRDKLRHGKQSGATIASSSQRRILERHVRVMGALKPTLILISRALIYGGVIPDGTCIESLLMVVRGSKDVVLGGVGAY
jgi:hypothetical protein